MTPHEILERHAALSELPASERAAALIVSLIADDESPAVILTLVATAAKLVRYLPSGAVQTRVKWLLGEILEELHAQWH
jgi:hypothetical protein